jgi:hypothetical protein
MELYALHGEPSGEFVIFADLVTGLAALGYKLTVVHTLCDFWSNLKSNSTYYDIIITDYDGLGTAENVGDFPINHCRYFIVDGFGTQPEFNKRKLNLKRILTPYPFDGTNTAIHMITDQLPREKWSPTRFNQLVIWAKSFSYLRPEHLASLRHIAQRTNITIVGTFGELRKFSPALARSLSFIQALPLLNRTEFHYLLSASRILLGVEKPLDGPTALESIAHGCVYLNPLFSPPRLVSGKPTNYRYTSQHPFIEREISPPHSYLIDFRNQTAIDSIVSQILSSQQPLPYLHPHHIPSSYLRNLRNIFSGSAQQQCQQNQQPLRHPGNDVYESFIDFLQSGCGKGKDAECQPHWSAIDVSNCIPQLIDENIRRGVPYELRGNSLYMKRGLVKTK